MQPPQSRCAQRDAGTGTQRGEVLPSPKSPRATLPRASPRGWALARGGLRPSCISRSIPGRQRGRQPRPRAAERPRCWQGQGGRRAAPRSPNAHVEEVVAFLGEEKGSRAASAGQPATPPRSLARCPVRVDCPESANSEVRSGEVVGRAGCARLRPGAPRAPAAEFGEGAKPRWDGANLGAGWVEAAPHPAGFCPRGGGWGGCFQLWWRVLGVVALGRFGKLGRVPPEGLGAAERELGAMCPRLPGHQQPPALPRRRKRRVGAAPHCPLHAWGASMAPQGWAGYWGTRTNSEARGRVVPPGWLCRGG